MQKYFRRRVDNSGLLCAFLVMNYSLSRPATVCKCVYSVSYRTLYLPCPCDKEYSYYVTWAGSSVGIMIELRAGRSGIEYWWGRDIPPVQTGPGAHPSSCKMGTGSFPGIKCDQGVLLTTHPLLVPRSWKSRAIPLPTLWATPGL